MDKQLITADNISSSLSFNEKLSSYEENIAQLSVFDSKINALTREIDEIRTNHKERSKETNAYYPKEGMGIEYDLDNNTGDARQLFVYKKKDRNEEFDKLYTSFGQLTVVQRDSKAMKVLNDRFPGFTEYLSELANYFYTSFDEIDKEETNKVRAKFVELNKELRKTRDDRDIVASKVLDVERFINTAEKVSNIGKYNKDKLKD